MEKQPDRKEGLKSYRILVRQEHPLKWGKVKLPDGRWNVDTAAEPGWVAMCLDHWIVAQGESMADAMESLALTMQQEDLLREGGFESLDPAPPEYWEALKR